MLRTVMIGGLVVLALALGVSTWTSWLAQTNLRQQLAEVTAKLETMAETQPLPTTGTISGVAYLGEKSKPAVGVGVQLLKAPPRQIGDRAGQTADWVVERTLATDSAGRYRFEALVPGTYSVMTPLSETDSAAWQWGGVQSRPASLAPGESLDFPIDVKLRSGTLRIALSQTLPGPFKVGEHELHLSVEGVISQWPLLPISDNLAESIDDWPVRGYSNHSGYDFKQRFCYLPNRGFHVGNLRSMFSTIGGQSIREGNWDALEVLRHEQQSDPTKLVPIFSNPSYHVPKEAPRAPREDESWIAGKYSIWAMLLVLESTGHAISIEELKDKYRFTQDPIMVNWIHQEFEIAEGAVTELRVMIPDEIDELGKALAKLQHSILTDSNYASLRSSLMSRDSGRGEPQEFANLLNHPFEVEVTGPKPAE